MVLVTKSISGCRMASSTSGRYHLSVRISRATDDFLLCRPGGPVRRCRHLSGARAAMTPASLTRTPTAAPYCASRALRWRPVADTGYERNARARYATADDAHVQLRCREGRAFARPAPPPGRRRPRAIKDPVGHRQGLCACCPGYPRSVPVPACSGVGPLPLWATSPCPTLPARGPPCCGYASPGFAGRLG